LREVNNSELPKYKVEVKNIGSISLLQKIIDFEINRQSEILEQGEIPIQETRGAKDMTGETLSQRVKEDAQDYRYFPEPDIPPIEIDGEFISKVKGEIVELPGNLVRKYKTKYNLSDEICETLAAEKERSGYFAEFEELSKDVNVLSEIGKMICGKLAQVQQEIGKKLNEIIPNNELILLIAQKKIELEMNSTVYASILDKILSGTISDSDALNIELGMFLASSDNELEVEVSKIISADSEAKVKFVKNPNIVMFYVGQVMRNTKGKFNPEEIKKILIGLLS
jgi:aspartyl-tRNA(Asn)/glutamyl-tRNA(Gln) amidotransferase subunit B